VLIQIKAAIRGGTDVRLVADPGAVCGPHPGYGVRTAHGSGWRGAYRDENQTGGF